MSANSDKTITPHASSTNSTKTITSRASSNNQPHAIILNANAMKHLTLATKVIKACEEALKKMENIKFAHSKTTLDIPSNEPFKRLIFDAKKDYILIEQKTKYFFDREYTPSKHEKPMFDELSEIYRKLNKEYYFAIHDAPIQYHNALVRINNAKTNIHAQEQIVNDILKTVMKENVMKKKDKQNNYSTQLETFVETVNDAVEIAKENAMIAYYAREELNLAVTSINNIGKLIIKAHTSIVDLVDKLMELEKHTLTGNDKQAAITERKKAALQKIQNQLREQLHDKDGAAFVGQDIGIYVAKNNIDHELEMVEALKRQINDQLKLRDELYKNATDLLYSMNVALHNYKKKYSQSNTAEFVAFIFNDDIFTQLKYTVYFLDSMYKQSDFQTKELNETQLNNNYRYISGVTQNNNKTKDLNRLNNIRAKIYSYKNNKQECESDALELIKLYEVGYRAFYDALYIMREVMMHFIHACETVKLLDIYIQKYLHDQKLQSDTYINFVDSFIKKKAPITTHSSSAKTKPYIGFISYRLPWI